jgi:uncharacterized protein
MDKKIKNKLAKILIIIYRIIKNLLFISDGSCKYIPNCSKYAEEAIIKMPIYLALIKIIWRILRCNPFSKGGYDPVIENTERNLRE